MNIRYQSIRQAAFGMNYIYWMGAGWGGRKIVPYRVVNVIKLFAGKHKNPDLLLK